MIRFILSCMLVLIVASPLFAGIKVEEVEYKIGTGEQTFRGYLAYDDAAKDKRPGVVVCHEWWGCNEYAASRARQLAEAGFVAFALDMYGKGNVTTDPKVASGWASGLDPKVRRERALAGYKLLSQHKMVNSTRIAAIGYCMGGTVALEMARGGADLKAIVCFHTSALTAANPDDNKYIKAKVLICHGDVDAFVEPAQIEGFKKQMADAGVDYQFICYGGAVHSFTNPGADAFKIEGVKYQAAADRRSWRHMLDLFNETIAAKP